MKQTLKLNRFWGMLLLAGCIMISMGTLAWSDSDKWNEGGTKYGSKDSRDGGGKWQQTAGVAVVINKLYTAECSACHFAYQPGFLPERSWVSIMGTLEDHFGENAKLDEASRTAIENYLRDHAADRVPNRFSRSILRSIRQGSTPLRISETDYFIHKHDEIPVRMVRNNPKVRSFANCVSCHGGAEKGSFDEHAVRIPGFKSWED